jgi:beta-N-acetylhexosaminidase
MTTPASPFLLCGIPGTSLDADERRLLGELRPGGIILFARNVASREQLLDLVGELRALPSRPYVAIDAEGGRVNRLRELIGELPSAAAAGARGAAACEALGEAIGAACAHLGVDADFAPVVDVSRREGYLGGEDRCFGGDVAAVTAAAERFLAGLEHFGVAGCLKHYPGLGSGAVDSHRALPLLDECVVDEERPFLALARPYRAVMVAHALAPALGEGIRPASLSAAVLDRLRRRVAGPVISDDLEMGALAEFGTLSERAAAALLAGCDQVAICNDMPARQAAAAAIARWSASDPVMASRVRASERRCAGFARGELRREPWAGVERLAERARRLAGMVA